MIRQVEVEWSSAGGQEVPHLSVEAGGGVEEQFTELMHAISVAGGVFQTGEEPTADGHSTTQTSGHISCKHPGRHLLSLQVNLYPQVSFTHHSHSHAHKYDHRTI